MKPFVLKLSSLQLSKIIPMFVNCPKPLKKYTVLLVSTVQASSVSYMPEMVMTNDLTSYIVVEPYLNVPHLFRQTPWFPGTNSGFLLR